MKRLEDLKEIGEKIRGLSAKIDAIGKLISWISKCLKEFPL